MAIAVVVVFGVFQIPCSGSLPLFILLSLLQGELHYCWWQWSSNSIYLKYKRHTLMFFYKADECMMTVLSRIKIYRQGWHIFDGLNSRRFGRSIHIKGLQDCTVGPDGRDRIVFRFQYIKALMPETLIWRRKNRGHLHTLDK